MKHDFIDKYSTLNSVLHYLDPRIKLLWTFLFLILVTASQQLLLFMIYLPVVVLLIVFSRVPLFFYFKKLVLVTPVAFLLSVFIYISYFLEQHIPFTFYGLTQYHPILATIGLMVAKIYISILVITLLISTTRFNDLLWGLRKFHLPGVVTTLSRLVYTYIFVFVDELHRTFRAYKSRTPVRRISRLKVYGNISAAILLRSIDRSDMIYKAMITRGFTGEFPDGNSFSFKRNDWLAGGCFLLLLMMVALVWKH